MPRRTSFYEWHDEAAYRAAVTAECHSRFAELFGEPCTAEWRKGWRRAVNHLIELDVRAREIRADRSVSKAAEFLHSHGIQPGTPARTVVTPQMFALQCEVDAALTSGRRVLDRVGEIPREVNKLTYSGLDAVVLLFESHTDEDGRPRWLSDRELAVVSLLLLPNRISASDPCTHQSDDSSRWESHDSVRLSPSVAIEREAKLVARVRRHSGELRTANEKREAIGQPQDRPCPRLKPVPGWVVSPDLGQQNV